MADMGRWVQTANGNAAAEAWGFGISPPLTVDESVKGILKVVSWMCCGRAGADVRRSMRRAARQRRGSLCRMMVRSCRGSHILDANSQHHKSVSICS